MLIPVLGGPYDGLRISALDLVRLVEAVELRSPAGTRHFFVLPAPEEWPGVRAGRMVAGCSRSRHLYEFLSTPRGPVLRHDATRIGPGPAERERADSDDDG